MKLIFIYGPPATGKLTVAKELAKLTNYNLLHNHLIFDMITSTVPWSNDKTKQLFEDIAVRMFEEATVQQVQGLIFTHVYRKPQHDEFIKRTIEVVEKNDGEVHLIQLIADVEVLKERILSEARKEHKKATKVETLEKILNKYDVLSTVSYKDSLVIDNSNILPDEVARNIVMSLKIKIS